MFLVVLRKQSSFLSKTPNFVADILRYLTVNRIFADFELFTDYQKESEFWLKKNINKNCIYLKVIKTETPRNTCTSFQIIYFKTILSFPFPPPLKLHSMLEKKSIKIKLTKHFNFPISIYIFPKKKITAFFL